MPVGTAGPVAGPCVRSTQRSSGKRELAVTEEIVHTTPFATLLRFRKDTRSAQPRVLIVAPMSGHRVTHVTSPLWELLGA